MSKEVVIFRRDALTLRKLDERQFLLEDSDLMTRVYLTKGDFEDMWDAIDANEEAFCPKCRVNRPGWHDCPSCGAVLEMRGRR